MSDITPQIDATKAKAAKLLEQVIRGERNDVCRALRGESREVIFAFAFLMGQRNDTMLNTLAIGFLLTTPQTGNARSDRDFTVVGKDNDDNLICRPNGVTDNSQDYNCGQSIEEFGVDNLSDEEKRTLGLLRPIRFDRHSFDSTVGVEWDDLTDADRAHIRSAYPKDCWPNFRWSERSLSPELPNTDPRLEGDDRDPRLL